MAAAEKGKSMTFQRHTSLFIQPTTAAKWLAVRTAGRITMAAYRQSPQIGCLRNRVRELLGRGFRVALVAFSGPACAVVRHLSTFYDGPGEDNGDTPQPGCTAWQRWPAAAARAGTAEAMFMQGSADGLMWFGGDPEVHVSRDGRNFEQWVGGSLRPWIETGVCLGLNPPPQ